MLRWTGETGKESFMVEVVGFPQYGLMELYCGERQDGVRMKGGVVPISVKKALLSLIPTRTRTQGSSPQPQSGQPPSMNRTLSSFCQEVNEQTPKGE
ncbi:hypothetical protein GOODEAATRI_025241 [Goodea atripinnis]|uniref:Uncharacterized protein n=1 Tax=Goodea atripinnis TaxID=208336 RepID=A0ABV0Q130_9TELE